MRYVNDHDIELLLKVNGNVLEYLETKSEEDKEYKVFLEEYKSTKKKIENFEAMMFTSNTQNCMINLIYLDEAKDENSLIQKIGLLEGLIDSYVVERIMGIFSGHQNIYSRYLDNSELKTEIKEKLEAVKSRKFKYKIRHLSWVKDTFMKTQTSLEEKQTYQNFTVDKEESYKKTDNAVKMNKEDDGNFVVLSDFHNTTWPLDKIANYYVNEVDKIYILGDATDRGSEGNGKGSVEMLLAIKNLTERYPGKVEYLAGNHDQMLYNYMKGNPMGEEFLKANKQDETIKEVENLKKYDMKTFGELKEFLGSRKLQAVHNYNGKKYCLAHALFNQKLFDSNPNLTLEKCSELSKEDNINSFMTLWFRDKNPQLNTYNPKDMPSDDNAVMVVGHTPDREEFEVFNAYGNTIHAYVVDGGVFNGREYMPKFLNGKVFSTYMDVHSSPDIKPGNNTNNNFYYDMNSTNNDEKDVIVKVTKLF